MKILYLSQRFNFERAGIYADLMNALVADNHDVTIVSCRADSDFDYSRIYEENGCKMLYVKVGNQFGVNVIKKAVVQFSIPHKMLNGIKKHLCSQSYDMILYPTPPITFSPVVKWCKNYFKAKSYLMLKDIFPQNAVDLGMIKKNSPVHILYKYIEQKLYSVSDCIGCMTPENQNYLKRNYNQNVWKKSTIFPNTINCEKLKADLTHEFRKNKEQTTFLFGGNMGKPQAVDFLLECIKNLKCYSKASFKLIGNGSEVEYIQNYITAHELKNVTFSRGLPREEYEKVVADCDVGLIVLNNKFTIPNCPARLLSYMAKGIPILAATDVVTDIKGIVTEEANCGFWCQSNDVEAFCSIVKNICELQADDLEKLGDNGLNYIRQHFDVKASVDILNNFMSEN